MTAKREIVAAHMAGVTNGITNDVVRNIEDAAREDVADMERGGSSRPSRSGAGGRGSNPPGLRRLKARRGCHATPGRVDTGRNCWRCPRR